MAGKLLFNTTIDKIFLYITIWERFKYKCTISRFFNIWPKIFLELLIHARYYGSLGWPPKFQPSVLGFWHWFFEVVSMTSALGEMAKGFVPMISALADEERIETQDVELTIAWIEMQRFKADISTSLDCLLDCQTLRLTFMTPILKTLFMITKAKNQSCNPKTKVEI